MENKKPIQPIKAVYNNNSDAVFLTVNIIYDNLSSYCNLYWGLLDADLNTLLSGNLAIDGDDYLSWNGNNEFPYTFTAEKINVTLIN